MTYTTGSLVLVRRTTICWKHDMSHVVYLERDNVAVFLASRPVQHALPGNLSCMFLSASGVIVWRSMACEQLDDCFTLIA